jgi:hypothetical protein
MAKCLTRRHRTFPSLPLVPKPDLFHAGDSHADVVSAAILAPRRPAIQAQLPRLFSMHSMRGMEVAVVRHECVNWSTFAAIYAPANREWPGRGMA